MNALTENVDILKVHKYRFLMISSPTYSKHKKNAPAEGKKLYKCT